MATINKSEGYEEVKKKVNSTPAVESIVENTNTDAIEAVAPNPDYFIGVLSRMDRSMIQKEIIDKITSSELSQMKVGKDGEESPLYPHLNVSSRLLIDFLIIIACSEGVHIESEKLDRIWENIFCHTEYRYAISNTLPEYKQEVIALYNHLHSGFEGGVTIKDIQSILETELRKAQNRISIVPLEHKPRGNQGLLAEKPAVFFTNLMSS